MFGTVRDAPRAFVRRVVLSLVFLPACATEQSPVRAGAFADGGDAATSFDAGALPNADPKDLDAKNGDPSLDIASSGLFFDNDVAWVRVVFYGDWPPPSQLDSWSCATILGTENAPVVNYTVHASHGAQTAAADGIVETKVTFAQEPRGFRVRFGDPTLAFDRYGIECTVQRSADGIAAQDTSGNFVITEKIQRGFGN